MKSVSSLLVVLCISKVIICEVTHITPDINLTVCIDHPCFTLPQFATRIDLLNRSNVTLSLISGNHILSTELVVTNTNRLAMSPSNGDVTITCQHSGSFNIKSVNSVIVNGITFQKCSGSRFVNVSNLVLSELTFYSQDMASMIKLINTSTTIIRSSFIGNATHSHHLMSTNGGAIIAINNTISIRESSFVSYGAIKGGAIYATRGNKLMVQNCRFSHNRAMSGGALLADGNSYMYITESNFTNNVAEYGGALFIEHSNATLGGSTLNNNTAQSDTLMTGKGGAMFVDGRSIVAITNCSISNNTAVSGGGLYTRDCKVFVEYSDVSNNHAVNSGGALYCSKNSSITSNSDMSNASVSREYHFCNVFIRNNSRIINNHAYNNGGGLYNDGNFLSLERSHISDNFANYGGGVYGYKCTMVLNGNAFTLNTAVLGGGAMCLKDSHPTEIDNSTFSQNEVKYGKGAAIQSHAVVIRLVQCTVNDNTAIECGAIEATMIEINDSIFRSNNAAGLDEVGGGGALCVRSGYISVERSIFEHNMAMKDSGVMIIENSTLRMLDTVFINNRASWIGGIKATSSNITIINCQFCNSTGTVE